MSFGKNRPPLVPDPGQQVDLLAENGQTLHGFRAVSVPLSYERGGAVGWVATEAEFRDAQREGRPAGSQPPARPRPAPLRGGRRRGWGGDGGRVPGRQEGGAPRRLHALARRQGNGPRPPVEMAEGAHEPH